jgi:hypothetical protein
MKKATIRHAALALLLGAVGLHAALLSYQSLPSDVRLNATTQAAEIGASAPPEE